MTTEAEGIAAGTQISYVVAAVRAMTTDAAQFFPTQGIAAATNRVEAMRQILMAAFTQGIGAFLKQSSVVAAMGLVAGCTLGGKLLGVLCVTETRGLLGMALAAKLAGAGKQQCRLGAAVWTMTRCAFTVGYGFVRHRNCGLYVAGGANVAGHDGQLLRLVAMELRMAVVAVAIDDRLMATDAVGGQNIVMTGRTGLGNVGAGGLRLMGRMAGAAGRESVGGVPIEGVALIKRLRMTALASFRLGFDQKIGLVAAMSVMAKQTFTLGDFGMSLMDDLSVIFMACVTYPRLISRQQGGVGVFVEGGMAVLTLSLLVRRMGTRIGGGSNQLLMTSAA